MNKAVGNGYFFYLSVKISHDQVDVNVNPRKKEVSILEEDSLCSSLYSQLFAKLSKIVNFRKVRAPRLIDRSAPLRQQNPVPPIRNTGSHSLTQNQARPSLGTLSTGTNGTGESSAKVRRKKVQGNKKVRYDPA